MARNWTKNARKSHDDELAERGLLPGYYLVKNGARHYISRAVDLAALEKVCDRVLSDAVGWNYWIDYSFGPSVTSAPAWGNLDYTDQFF